MCQMCPMLNPFRCEDFSVKWERPSLVIQSCTGCKWVGSNQILLVSYLLL
jgi:hypothetical protein